jgi:hypothetical protein
MRDARILLQDTFFKIKLSFSLAIAIFVVSDFGFVFSSLTTKLATANEQLSFILKNLSSNRTQNEKVHQKCNSSKYLSAFLQAIRHQSRHPGWYNRHFVPTKT